MCILPTFLKGRKVKNCLLPALLVGATFSQLAKEMNKAKLKEEDKSGKIKPTLVDLLFTTYHSRYY